MLSRLSTCYSIKVIRVILSDITQKKATSVKGIPIKEYSCHFDVDPKPGNMVLMRHQFPWWRHQMETFLALLAICAGNSPVPGEFPHKYQWRGGLMFSLICAWINGWVNRGEAGDLRHHCANCDVTLMHNHYEEFLPLSLTATNNQHRCGNTAWQGIS